MGSARRLYVYFASSVSLLTLSVGAYWLAWTVADRIVQSVAASVISGGDVARGQMSLALALVGIGLPLWLVHTWISERAVGAAGATGDEERHSTIRAFHMALVQAVALAVGAAAAVDLATRLVGLPLGVDVDSGWAGPVAALSVAIPAWVYHAARRRHDIRRARQRGAAAWLTRLYRYAAAFAGTMILLASAASLVGLVLDLLAGPGAIGGGRSFVAVSVAGSVAGMLVGLVVWWIHWADAEQTIRDRALIGEDDRASRLRAAYVSTVLLVTAVYAGIGTATAVAELARALLGVADWSGAEGFGQFVVRPPAAALPFVAWAWMMRATRRAEVLEVGPLATASDQRVTRYVLAIAGLAFIVIGATRTLAGVIDLLVGGQVVGGDDGIVREVTWFIGQLLVGAALWVPAWTAVLRSRLRYPAVERGAQAGRAYLYLVAGLALAAVVPAAVFVLYRLIDTGLGASTGSGVPPELSAAVATIVVAGLVGLGHGRMALADQRFAPHALRAPTASAQTSPTAMVTGATPGSAVPPVSPTPLAVLGLHLRGPADADLATIAAQLREHLPAGVTLEQDPG